LKLSARLEYNHAQNYHEMSYWFFIERHNINSIHFY
jgi:hypothetical protein